MRRLGRKGFTLVEIMIVVAIIILLAAIAIPNLLRARLNANEASAIASLRTVSTAFESYRAAQTVPMYPDAVDTLGLPDSDPPYIDAALSGGTKQGYSFVVVGTPTAHTYNVTATPITVGTTGNRSFWVGADGVLFEGTDPIQ